MVGHSNTTPALVKFLGGDPGAAMDESIYTRLYQVSIDDSGKVRSVLLHFNHR